MNERLVIVGAGEIGRRLANAAASLDMSVTRVTRSENTDALRTSAGSPVIVCVRENELAGVLADVPPSRGPDLVFVQNGFIEELVEPYVDHTRAVLWFTAKGTFFADLLPSPVHGPRFELVRSLVNAAGATAEAIQDKAVFQRLAIEKAIWSCVVGAPLAVWGCDLETARHEHMTDIEAIVREACEVVQKALGAEISPQRVLAVLDDTSRQLGWMRGGTKPVAWRNGKVVEWGARYGVATPANRAVFDAATQTETVLVAR